MKPWQHIQQLPNVFCGQNVKKKKVETESLKIFTSNFTLSSLLILQSHKEEHK